jgi:type VI secretion system protein ImpC
MLRRPFGAKTDPIERFQFEEQTTPPRHESYLWGNPAVACACMLAQSFSEYGWSFRPGMVDTLDGLPTHVYDADGESTVKPCAEAWLTERAIERITDAGLFAVTSILSRDAVRISAFRSMSSANPRLAGRWNRS